MNQQTGLRLWIHRELILIGHLVGPLCKVTVVVVLFFCFNLEIITL